MLQFRPSKGFFNFFVQEKQTIPKYSRHTQLVLTQYTTDRENLYAVIKNLQLAFFSFDTNIGSINIQIPEHNIKQFKDNATDVLDGSNFSLFPK
jgi:predicted DNA binding CopG/RHH family protein